MSQPADEPVLNPASRSISPWRSVVGTTALVATTALSLPAIAAFAGRGWWILELAGHFRIQYFWGLFLGTVLLIVGGRLRSAAGYGTFLLLHAAMLWPFYTSSPGDFTSSERGRRVSSQSVRVASVNLLMENNHYDDVLNFVQEASPDVILFLEVDPVWDTVLRDLAADWPYYKTQPERNNFGIALFSRIPLDDVKVEFLGNNYPALIAKLRFHGKPITLVGAHPMSPIGQSRHQYRDWQLKRVGKLLAETRGEKLLIGDLNCTSWSPAFRDLVTRSGLRDSRLGLGVQASWPTWLPEPFRIPIDHCLVSPGLQVEDRMTGPFVGSDHLPIVVDLVIKKSGTQP